MYSWCICVSSSNVQTDAGSEDESTGIEKDLTLPAIAVVALPRGSGIVTRCLLELKRRKSFGGKWKVKIRYQGILETFEDPSLVEIHVRTAQNTLAGDGVGICDDLITLEITSPDVCDLTLIDLPGITTVPFKDQPEDIGDQVSVTKLMGLLKNETINPVVVPCNVDIATTEAMRMAHSVDPKGARTLDIITIPDLVGKGAEPEKSVIGQVVHLNKGYVIVKCPGQSDIIQKISLADHHFIPGGHVVTYSHIGLWLVYTRVNQNFSVHLNYSPLLEQNKVTIQCLSTRSGRSYQIPLPYLTDEIREHLETVKTVLKKYSTGPPLKRTKMGLKDFIDKIPELCRTGKGVHTFLHPVFQQWYSFLSKTKESRKSCGDHDKELACCIYEHAVQKHIFGLQELALKVLKLIPVRDVWEACFKSYPQLRCLTKTDKIHLNQEAKVEKKIKEYTNMEPLVYGQDTIFVKGLKDHEDHFKEAFEEEQFNDPDEIEDKNTTATFNCAVFDTRKLTLPPRTLSIINPHICMLIILHFG
uniref:Dynamin GTPase domain-containing protein n=1 Tax=Oncorhynchus tshawytscha TaxID=74940 RepID=A0A8C8CYU7_ONCTS